MSYANGVSDGDPWGTVFAVSECPNCGGNANIQLLTMKKFGERICNHCKIVYQTEAENRT